MGAVPAVTITVAAPDRQLLDASLVMICSMKSGGMPSRKSAWRSPRRSSLLKASRSQSFPFGLQITYSQEAGATFRHRSREQMGQRRCNSMRSALVPEAPSHMQQVAVDQSAFRCF
eukprot:COSAG05_NODE_2393_length_3124_cov_5.020489_5_plen_116_part_00